MSSVIEAIECAVPGVHRFDNEEATQKTYLRTGAATRNGLTTSIVAPNNRVDKLGWPEIKPKIPVKKNEPVIEFL